MKIKRIEVLNYKPIENEEINLNGCSAIITAGNGRGKSSLLTGLIDRFHSEKADEIVKEGEEKGYNIMELTDGSRIEWNFTKKSERFAFITEDKSGNEIRQTSGIIGKIGEKYFGKKFDVDKFINDSPKKQQQQLEEMVGMDISVIEDRYNQAYNDRTEKNREYTRLKDKDLSEPEKVEEPDIESVKKKIANARNINSGITEAKNKVSNLRTVANSVHAMLEGTDLAGCFDAEKVKSIIESAKPKKEMIDVYDLEAQLEQAQQQQRKFDNYKRDLQDYNNWQKDLKSVKEAKDKADEKVKSIEQEKKEAIANADMPEGFNIAESGLTYNGFAFDNNQISTSEKYIAALKLGSLVLGEVKTLHFDASMLDKSSFKEVNQWANNNDLQLLIEKPDWDGGKIKYNIINNKK